MSSHPSADQVSRCIVSGGATSTSPALSRVPSTTPDDPRLSNCRHLPFSSHAVPLGQQAWVNVLAFPQTGVVPKHGVLLAGQVVTCWQDTGSKNSPGSGSQLQDELGQQLYPAAHAPPIPGQLHWPSTHSSLNPQRTPHPPRRLRLGVYTSVGDRRSPAQRSPRVRARARGDERRAPVADAEVSIGSRKTCCERRRSLILVR